MRWYVGNKPEYLYSGVMNKSFISVSPTQRSGIFKMNKDELVELLAKSQEAILERVDSKLQDLKRSISEDQEDCVRSVAKMFKEDHSIFDTNMLGLRNRCNHYRLHTVSSAFCRLNEANILCSSLLYVGKRFRAAKTNRE